MKFSKYLLFFVLICGQALFAQTNRNRSNSRNTARATAQPAGPKVTTHEGVLQHGDQNLEAGEFADVYTFEARAGESITIDLTSDDFDTYLILTKPDDQNLDNDDFEGSSSRSQIALEVESAGTFKVTVTSYKPYEKGAYKLIITQQDLKVLSNQPARNERGTLARSDSKDADGKFFDTYTLNGAPGQSVKIELTSSAFDPYLVLKAPSGSEEFNDDFEGSTTKSALDVRLNEAGVYQIVVSSYEAGKTGAYQLSIQSSVTPQRPSNNNDTVSLVYGNEHSGRLAEGDAQLSTNEFRDIFVFDGKIGDQVVVDMTSSDFDTYLFLTLPSGQQIDNDDFEGSSSHSRIELTLREEGRYRISATSYKPDMTGNYRLTLEKTGEGIVEDQTPTGSGGNIYGIFMGISNYAGRMSNLNYTDKDPVTARDALIEGAGMPSNQAITLIDAQATAANFINAIDQLAARMDNNDTFVLFYSGHGGRYDRDSGYQSTDPDGVDESIELRDREIKDDEMAELLDKIPAKVQLIVFDSCFSGGFAKDLISKPGRMGMFSSEEDVTSNVASKFLAGGYLPVFFADAIKEKLADEDRNSDLTALEISHYIHERYRNQVKSADRSDQYVSQDDHRYQHLVVDRGSIGAYDVLFKLK